MLLPVFLFFCSIGNAWSATEVHVEKAGTLSTLLTTCETAVKITGSINGTDIKYIRELINGGKVTELDLSKASIVSGGEKYDGSNSTEDDIIGPSMFDGFSKLKAIELPEKITEIKSNAFANSGLRKINIPENVTSLGDDAFAYCGSLEQVVIGSKMKTLSKGAFYSSPVKEVFVFATTPPNVEASYIFSSNPTVHVYKASLDAYKASKWAEYAGKIVGDLDNYTSIEQPQQDVEENDANAPIYDLSGRRVKELQPGKMYIRKGKKFIAK